jgi:DNA polymerase alpha subunit B
MAAETTAELREYFAMGATDLEPDIASELQSIMRLHQLSAEDMFYKWESYCIKMDMDTSSLSITSVRSFKQDVQDALEKSNRLQTHIKQEKRPSATPRPGAKTGDVFNMYASAR